MSARSDLDVAVACVRRAGAILLEHRGRVTVSTKSAPTDVVTEADREAEAAVAALLAAERPDDGILGEEGAAVDGARQWTIDALDGTLNFTLGLPGFCAAVALQDADGTLLAAAVHDPVRDELYAAARGAGATCNGTPLRVSAPDDPAAAVVATWIKPDTFDGEHADGMVALMRAAGSMRITGSGTLELAAVAAGRLHAWAQAAPAPWDWRPGALLVAEAGGVLVERGAWRVAAAGPLARALAAQLPAG